MRNVAKIDWPVVSGVAVDVVNLAGWPSTMSQCKYHSVRADPFAEERAGQIPMPAALVGQRGFAGQVAVPVVGLVLPGLLGGWREMPSFARLPCQRPGLGVKRDQLSQQLNGH